MDTINIDVSNNKKSEIIIQEGLKDNIADFLEDEKCFLITNVAKIIIIGKKRLAASKICVVVTQ